MPAAPEGQAARDMDEAEATQGRTMMGIVRRVEDPDENHEESGLQTGHEMIGLVDFRLHWPSENTAYLGMLMVAEPYQRQGVGAATWDLLRPWLAGSAGMDSVRLGVEQFNPGALNFFQKIGFVLTGETNRISVGKKWIRLLYMEQQLDSAP